MATKMPKLNPEWVKQARDQFQAFLEVTKFPHPLRHGMRGSTFDDPEWLILVIAVLSVKAHVKNYLAIPRLAVQHWDIHTEGLNRRTRTKPISESQLRDRLKNICHAPGKPAAFIRDLLRRAMTADGLGQKLLPAFSSRCSVRRKSIVFPYLSTARYK